MNKQIKTWLFIAIASFLGWIGISNFGKFQQEHSVQQQALAQVLQLVTEADNIKNLDLNSLKDSQTKLQQTIATLEKIPNLPGLPYQKAQKDLADLRPRVTVQGVCLRRTTQNKRCSYLTIRSVSAKMQT